MTPLEKFQRKGGDRPTAEEGPSEGREPSGPPEPLVGDPEHELPGTKPGPGGEEALPQGPQALESHCLNKAVPGTCVDGARPPGRRLVHHPGLYHVGGAAQGGRREARREGGQGVGVDAVAADLVVDHEPLRLVVAG